MAKTRGKKRTQGSATESWSPFEEEPAGPTRAELERAQLAAERPDLLRPTQHGPRIVYGDEHDYLVAADPVYRAHVQQARHGAVNFLADADAQAITAIAEASAAIERSSNNFWLGVGALVVIGTLGTAFIANMPSSSQGT